MLALTAAEDGSFLPRTIPFTSGFKFPARAMEHAEAEKFKNSIFAIEVILKIF